MRLRPTVLFLALLLVSACDWTKTGPDVPPEHGYSHTLIYCAAGFNDLCTFLKEDLDDLKKGSYLPPEYGSRCLVAVTHFKEGSYSNLRPIEIIRIFSRNGKPVCDTLESIPGGKLLTEADVLRNVLEKVAEHCPSESYGLILSSHATGWLPSNYSGVAPLMASEGSQPVPRKEYRRRDYVNGPPVKSFGNEVRQNGYNLDGIELDIRDLSDAIPYKLEYILFDACFMGGIEVAYELKDKVDKVGFSQAEILVYGFEYTTLAERLVHGVNPDPEAVCRDYFEKYEKGPEADRSATISLVDCRRLDSLASVCGRLFSKYSEEIASVDASKVQRYFRYGLDSDERWYFDLEDIILKCDASEEDLRDLHDALGYCVLYKAATKTFMPRHSGFEIKHHCGLSSYLPKLGTSDLDKYYRSLEWNKATHLLPE